MRLWRYPTCQKSLALVSNRLFSDMFRVEIIRKLARLVKATYLTLTMMLMCDLAYRRLATLKPTSLPPAVEA